MLAIWQMESLLPNLHISKMVAKLKKNKKDLWSNMLRMPNYIVQINLEHFLMIGGLYCHKFMQLETKQK